MFVRPSGTQILVGRRGRGPGLFTGADPPVSPGRASATMYSEAGLLHNCVTCAAVLHVRDMNRRSVNVSDLDPQ